MKVGIQSRQKIGFNSMAFQLGVENVLAISPNKSKIGLGLLVMSKKRQYLKE